MAESFTLRVYSPKGLANEAVVESVTVPGWNGEIGVLANHAPYTGLLGVGLLRFKEGSASKETSLVVTGGFCKFENNVLTVLADFVDTPSNESLSAAIGEKESLRSTLEANGQDSDAWKNAHMQLRRIEFLEKAVSH